MNQDKSVNKATRDMLAKGLIKEGFTEDVKFHLRLVWTAGFNEYPRVKLNNHKRKIEMFALNGDKLDEFTDGMDLSRRMKIPYPTIRDYLTGRIKRARGRYYFRYAES